MQRVTDSLDSADTQVLVRDLKHELKDWEAEFQTRHGRAATKDDMLQRPEVARKYKQYSKLKKQLAIASTSSSAVVLLSSPAVLELETSSLKLPLKRKPEDDLLSTNEEPRPALDADVDVHPDQAKCHSRAHSLTELKNSCSINRITTESPFESDRISANNDDVGNEAGDGSTDRQLDDIVPTLKRRCTGLPVTSRKQGYCSETVTKISRARRRQPLDSQELANKPVFESKQEKCELLADSGSKPQICKTDVAESDTAKDIESEEIEYMPLPSLIRQYTQPSVFSLQTNPAIRSLASSSSTSQGLGSPLLRSLNMMTMSENEPTSGSVGISMPQFKARAGKLVKTTSIPLSAFGEKAKVSFETEPLKGHTSDRNGDRNGYKGSDNGSADLDASELVDDSNSDGDYQSETNESKPVHKKKTTQKRSTRRVKLKPVDKQGNVPNTGSTRASGSQNLVSNNFYKVRLKSSRRGPKSSEERRTALYKRMVGKKGV
ncbi:hypothetical protein LPJ57_008024 [Coemansia sp. RSA 486]|nr:hypothetical protein LPJ57_008024 [Coemansia sp. RSA 486]